jgi:hypothetical protein
MKKFFHFSLVFLFSLALALVSAPAFGAEIAALIGFASLVSQYVAPIAGSFGLNNTNNYTARESYNHARKMFFRAFRDKFQAGPGGDQACENWVNSLKLSQSEIRLEVNLLTTSNSFIFGVTPNQANSSNVQFATETRLNLQDSLCVNEYGIFVGLAAGNNDTAWPLNTYGNTQVFAAADAAALDSTFYSNGGFQVKCNNDVICPYRGLFNHWYKPQTQQTAALGAGSPKDQIRGAEDGCITAEPNIVLIGSKNYVPEIVLKSAMASAAANLRAVVIFRGILAQNSTVVS